MIATNFLNPACPIVGSIYWKVREKLAYAVSIGAISLIGIPALGTSELEHHLITCKVNSMKYRQIGAMFLTVPIFALLEANAIDEAVITSLLDGTYVGI